MVVRFEERPEGFNQYINHQGKTIRINKMLAHYLLCQVEFAKKKKLDVIGLLVGEEGSGKSTLVRQIGYFLDRTLTEKSIEFDPENAIQRHYKGLPEKWNHRYYLKGHYEGKPFEVIILDESADLNRKRTMSQVNVDFVKFLTQSRVFHKIFFLVVPSPYIFEKYIGEFRAKFLINTKFDKRGQRVFNYYNRKGLRRIYNVRSTEQNAEIFNKVHPVISGNFTGADPFDTELYDDKKTRSTDQFRKEIPHYDNLSLDQARKLWEKKIIERGFEAKVRAKPMAFILDVPSSVVRHIYNGLKEDQEKSL